MKIERASKIKKPGEHAVKVRNLRLFHLDQTAALSAAEKKQALADL
jgi:hypothetical protein